MGPHLGMENGGALIIQAWRVMRKGWAAAGAGGIKATRGPAANASLLLSNRVSSDPAVGVSEEDRARPRGAHARHMNLEFGGIAITVPSILNNPLLISYNILSVTCKMRH
jgi:hypothetical protein